MKKYLFLLFGLFLIPNESVSQSNQTERRFDFKEIKKTLTAEISKVLKETGIPSISLALIKGDTIVW